MFIVITLLSLCRVLRSRRNREASCLRLARAVPSSLCNKNNRIT